MTVRRINLTGKSLRSQRYTNVIYQCRIFILLFIWNQNPNHIPFLQAGKSGNVSPASLNAADLPFFLQNSQCRPDGLAADTVSGRQFLFGRELVPAFLNIF